MAALNGDVSLEERDRVNRTYSLSGYNENQTRNGRAMPARHPIYRFAQLLTYKFFTYVT